MGNICHLIEWLIIKIHQVSLIKHKKYIKPNQAAKRKSVFFSNVGIKHSSLMVNHCKNGNRFQFLFLQYNFLRFTSRKIKHDMSFWINFLPV